MFCCFMYCGECESGFCVAMDQKPVFPFLCALLFVLLLDFQFQEYGVFGDYSGGDEDCGSDQTPSQSFGVSSTVCASFDQ